MTRLRPVIVIVLSNQLIALPPSLPPVPSTLPSQIHQSSHSQLKMCPRLAGTQGIETWHSMPLPASLSCHSPPQPHIPAVVALLTSPQAQWLQVAKLAHVTPLPECPTHPVSLVIDSEEDKASLAPLVLSTMNSRLSHINSELQGRGRPDSSPLCMQKFSNEKRQGSQRMLGSAHSQDCPSLVQRRSVRTPQCGRTKNCTLRT